MSSDSGFDKVAGFYDAWARLVFGRSIRKAQSAFLDEIPDGAKVLLVGGGTGWILSYIFSKGNPASVLFLDASPQMVKKAQNYVHTYLPDKKSQIIFRANNENGILPTETFDVIFTPFLLDLFEPTRLRQLFAKLDSTLVPGGLWLFTDFSHPKSGFRPIARIMTWLMYRIFGILTGISGKKLPDFAAYFREFGYKSLKEKSFFHGMIKTIVFRRIH